MKDEILAFFEDSNFKGVVYGDGRSVKVFDFYEGGYEGYIETDYADLLEERDKIAAEIKSKKAILTQLKRDLNQYQKLKRKLNQ